MYIYTMCMMHLNIEGRGEKAFKQHLKCFVGALLDYNICAFLSHMSSEANLLSLDDSDGPFSPNEEKKVNNWFILW